VGERESTQNSVADRVGNSITNKGAQKELKGYRFHRKAEPPGRAQNHKKTIRSSCAGRSMGYVGRCYTFGTNAANGGVGRGKS